MPRPRKTAANLPPYVYIRRGWYVLRGYLGQGRLGKDVKLCPADAPLSEVWARYESQTTRGAIRKTVAWLIGEYLKSPQHASKSPKTRAEYEKAGEHFKNYPLRSGGLFGEVDAERVTPGVVRKYLDNRANAPVAANRAVAFLSVCFSWAVERDILRANPCKDVRRNSEKARVRYVTDAEYSAIHALAGELGWKHVQVAMELAYLCRMRLCEVLGMTQRDLKDEGVHVRRRKGSRDNLTTWTPRLRAAIAEAKNLALPAAVPIDPAIVRSQTGDRLTESGFQTTWQRLMTAAFENGVIEERFTFHDLKAKGISDSSGDKQAASGHKTAAMVTVYDRKLTQVKPAGEE